jgi:hypothetical protein
LRKNKVVKEKTGSRAAQWQALLRKGNPVDMKSPGCEASRRGNLLSE